MQKIRIKQTPKAGDQRDFSLVQKQAHYISEGVPSETPVKNTMGAIPREQANIEVEGGETVVGDVNKDGFLEHMTFVGKRHSEGGVPVNIPEGSSIFSDTKKLKIKDKEALKTMFGLSYKKGGYTPAEIAKRYQVNGFINDLKNPETDEITKRSATKMLENNMEKLGMLALMQESMKGFPDGVPAIAESVMAGLEGQAASEQQTEMKNGGKVLRKAQQGLNVNQAKKIYDEAYQSGDPAKMRDASKRIKAFKDSPWYSWAWVPGTNEWNFDIYEDMLESRAESIEKQERPRQEKRAMVQKNVNALASQYQSDYDKLMKGESSAIDPSKYEALKKLFTMKSQLDNYDKRMRGEAADLKNVNLFDGPEYYDKLINQIGEVNKTLNSNAASTVENGAKTTFKKSSTVPAEGNTAKDEKEIKTLLEKPFEEFVGKKPVTTTPSSGAKSAPVKSKPIKAGDTHASIDDFFSSYKSGGYVYQDAGTVKEEPKPEVKPEVKTEVKPETAPKSDSKPYAQGIVDGKKVFIYYEGDNKILKDEQGNVLKSAKVSGSFVPHQGDKNPSKNPVTGKVEAGWNKSKYTPEKIDELARARGYNGPRDNKKLQEWIMSRPEYSKVVNELHTKYGQPKAGKEVDGFWGIRWDDALNAIPEQPKPETPVEKPAGKPPVVTTAKKDETVASQEPVPAPKKKSGTWWLQDIVNFTGTLTDQVNRYEPTQGKIDLQTPGYATLDPTRRLAANQEQFARLQDMTQNTTDGNVGLAAMTGAQGQAFANAANAIGEVENANVGIVNQAYAQNANIMNQEAGANEAGRQKYVEDMATLNQQYDNSLQQKKWRQIAAFNNGTSNWFRKKQMEQVLFPDIYVDPLTGDVDVDPSARDPLGYQTYAPAYGNGKTGVMGMGDYGLSAYKEIYDSVVGTMGEKEAAAHARWMVQEQMKNANNARTTRAQSFGNAMQQGNTLGAHGLSQNAFGGTVDYPWIDLD